MSKRVFIVEDDAAFAGELRVAFEGAGFAVECFETANAAMGAVQKAAPVLVVSGAMLEDLGSGFRLSQWVKNNAPDLPVVMVTGIDTLTGQDFESRVRSGELKADAYIKKPVAADVVLKQATALIK